MAMLRTMLSIKSVCGGIGQLHVVHVDHGLRGSESTADAQWLAQQCDALQTPLTICHGDVRRLAAAQGDGLEAAARDQRYRLLTQAAEQIGARYVAMGHNANDQTETVLFRLLRGSGIRGLSGIRNNRPLSPSVTLVRPQLGCWHKDLVNYLKRIGQPFREDQPNRDTRFTRNRIRHDLLPRLRSDYNERIEEALLRLAEQATAAEQLIETEADHLLARCALQLGPHLAKGLATGANVVLTLQTAPLRQQTELLVSEAIRLAWRQAHLPEQAMTYRRWQQLAQFAQAPKATGRLQLPGKVQAPISAAQLMLSQHG
jgi:tRNA(Ile)-lysidine synthase